MIDVLLGLGLLAVVGALMWALVALYRETQRTRTSVAEAVQAALLQAEERHAREIAQVHETYRVTLSRVGNLVNYGTMTPPEAQVESEPTAEMRLGRAIQEDTIARGMAAMREQYEAAGIRVTEEELRDEVISIVLGAGAQEPASIAGLVHS